MRFKLKFFFAFIYETLSSITFTIQDNLGHLFWRKLRMEIYMKMKELTKYIQNDENNLKAPIPI